MSHFNWVICPEFLYLVFSRFPLALLHTIMVTRIVVDRPLLTTGCTLGEG
jgi:hypothetical protein